MTASIDHIAIPARAPERAARFLADLLGIDVTPEGPDGEFMSVRLGGDAMLLFVPASAPIPAYHIALRVAAREFDEVVRRLRATEVPFGNDPDTPTNDRSDDPLGGHGRVYFVDTEGHLFEVCS
jgi:catechol 2,3-dioxygenase-like lactoylglutathione lyase family enzyme